MADFGADPATHEPSQSALSRPSSECPGEFDCPYGNDQLDEAIAWHSGYRAALKWMMENPK